MAFIDKLFRFKKKPFGGDKKEKDTKRSVEVAKDAHAGPESRGTGAYAHVLVRSHISEKSSNLIALNQYVFEVNPAASKADIACAIKDLYGVRPRSVRTIRSSGKQMRYGKTGGTTKSWKKAMITLPEGKSIDVYKT